MNIIAPNAPSPDTLFAVAAPPLGEGGLQPSKAVHEFNAQYVIRHPFIPGQRSAPSLPLPVLDLFVVFICRYFVNWNREPGRAGGL